MPQATHLILDSDGFEEVVVSSSLDSVVVFFFFFFFFFFFLVVVVVEIGVSVSSVVVVVSSVVMDAIVQYKVLYFVDMNGQKFSFGEIVKKNMMHCIKEDSNKHRLEMIVTLEC